MYYDKRIYKKGDCKDDTKVLEAEKFSMIVGAPKFQKKKNVYKGYKCSDSLHILNKYATHLPAYW